LRSAIRGTSKIELAKVVGVAAAAVALAACSDRNVETSNRFDDGGPPPIQQGYFRAGSVAGLDFVSGSESGVTDAGGSYTCETNQAVSFSVGNIELGETLCSTLAHPAALSPSGTPLDTKAINIMRLLLILDGDEIFENGVAISEDLQILADSWSQIDFLADDFDAELAQIKSDIASVENRVVDPIPSEAAAFALLDTSIACAYSGIYINSVPAGPFNAITAIALTAYTREGIQPHVAEFMLVRNHPESQVFMQSLTFMQIQTLPTYAGSGVSGEFLTPDRVSGVYRNAIAQQVVDRNGAFVVFRAGKTNGSHRFAGSFEKLGGITGITTLRGRVVMTLDGDSLIGEAFDLLTGDGHDVSGIRVPGTNDFEFDVQGFPGSGTVTLVLNESGEPVGLEGTWPGYEEQVLQAAGCRLI